MIYLILIFLIITATPLWAAFDNRYLANDKVLYETPQEQDVLRVNTALGFCTVLEFPDKPTMVTVGDASLIQVEVPQSSKNVVIKPIEEGGETNLFVFTANQRFNYKVVIGDEHDVDYVIDTQKQISSKNKENQLKSVSISELLKKARNYSALKELGNINEREFLKKDLLYECHNPRFNVKVLEGFIYKSPHHLILHLKIKNTGSKTYELNERNTNVYIKGQKFQPQYVVLDEANVKPGFSTEAWLILTDTFISLDNTFTFGIGAGNEEAICY